MPEFVYHLVPRDLRGDMLLPLNRLREDYPDLAEVYTAKYAHRPHVPNLPVPHLDCTRGDVLMFAPVHPEELKAALLESGRTRYPTRFFAVDAARFTPNDTVLYVPGEKPEDATYTPYTPGCLDPHRVIPDVTRRYFCDTPQDKPVLLFGGVPHVFYRGTIPLAELTTVEV